MSRSCASSSSIRSRATSTSRPCDAIRMPIEFVWCQEEPQNQGAWYQIRHRLQEPLGPRQELLYAGRAPAAAPATGIPQLHAEQQHGLVTRRADRHDQRGVGTRDVAPACDRQQEGFMTIEVRVPQLPESVADATLVAWRKQPGDSRAARREPGRSRDRQGRARSAGADQRRAAGDPRPERCDRDERPDARRAGARRGSRKPAPRRRDGAGKAEPAGKAEAAAKTRDKAPAASAQGEGITDRGTCRDRRLAPSVRRLVEEHHLEPQTYRRQRARRPHHQGRRVDAPRCGEGTVDRQRRGTQPARSAIASGRAARSGQRARRASRADDAAARAYRRAAGRGAGDGRDADDLQRGRPHGRQRAAHTLQGSLREGARCASRLHVVLRQGEHRGAATLPARQRLGRRQRHRLSRVLRHRRRGVDRSRAHRPGAARCRHDVVRRYREVAWSPTRIVRARAPSRSRS